MTEHHPVASFNPFEITDETSRLANLGSLRLFKAPLMERVASDERRGLPNMEVAEFAALVIVGLLEEGRVEEAKAASGELAAFERTHSSSP